MRAKVLSVLVLATFFVFGSVLRECRGHETSDSHFGARFREGKGIEVSPETKTILGIETAEVEEQQFGSRTVTVVPASALLKTVTGSYVYVVNGKHFLRTQVTTGRAEANSVHVSDGLFPGDEVVTKPVNSLWYVELQALRGGKACADGH